MSNGKLLDDAMALPADERLELAMHLWDSIADKQEAVEITEEQMAELDRRLAEYKKDPTRTHDWQQVRDELLREL